MDNLRETAVELTRVWVPLYENDGHEEHNLVSEVAFEVFEPTVVREYATYRRGSGRTRTDLEIEPKQDWPACKFRAMGAYISQINRPDTRPWFCSDDCLREWVRP